MFLNYTICSSSGQLEFPPNSRVSDLNEIVFKSKHGGQVFDDSSFYVISNGKRLQNDTLLESEKTYHFVPRLLGGKGGFGSMLRAIGAQIEKTTSREACRDLSGRRMRDINNEKKLKEWLAKEAEREQEREERKKDRLAKHLRPQHKFDDEDYHEQKAKVQEDLQDALNTGLKRKMKNGEKSGLTQEKKSKGNGKPKAEWLGMDLDPDDLSSGDSDMEANPGDPNPCTSLQVNADDNDRLKSCEGDGDSKIKEENRLSINADDSVSGVIKQSQPDELPTNTEAPQKLSASPPKPNATELDSGRNGAATDVPSDAPIDLEKFSSSSELQALGLERLKNALMVRGLKCGGTLEERAVRLMTVKGLSPEEIQTSHPALLAKSGGKGGKVKKSK
ncbi:hypothetical protein EGW08_017765 [Elysia chlorotica]|uniref:Uncharacterized protein n=1 Tax=Elysia chlorotica TaxID=188477 RepID=A0A433SYU3_ELYCH|nr:hypothetical protein EGW08_017765 [Elysia chlorotica]